ncbi:MAG: hypothetical protein A3G34_13375 [Candidatus Lindowbacteria bacterium RIFCSPLOWO2_12_FULL_62_27]|nr:MAG: hypothetical protein A3I06_11085 [Candidatus Lindowbacteria bacterium RIFCSPLOWO2_02_FULL_62_12]OGH62574.1 MAG: hypothetical protein A3G34_13375 [Candidatus Lindowbacteria bacterium RIFCSPLOWO2_12_FULL_62_27]
MPKIMLVDQDRELFGLLTERLKEYRIEVIHAETGGDGFKRAVRDRPDVIIQELALPDISGFYLLEKIRTTESTGHIPVIVLTHRKDAKLEERVKQYGVSLFVRKPYPVRTFIARVKDLVAQPHARETAPRATAIPTPSAVYRLVTERLEVEVRTDHYLMRGLSSGINENGMGAHVNVLEKQTEDAPALEAGQPCTVYFRSIKYPLVPCQGQILRLEESWDRRYRQFVAIKFLDEESGGMPNADRQSLREWIEAQIKLG